MHSALHFPSPLPPVPASCVTHVALVKKSIHGEKSPALCPVFARRRSALHVAAAEGNLRAVQVLVEEGGADMGLMDRWGNTALDDARRVDASAVIDYLQVRLAGRRGAARVCGHAAEAAHWPPRGSPGGGVRAMPFLVCPP